MNWYAIYQGVLQNVSVAGLVAIATVAGVGIVAAYLSPVVKWMRRHRLDAALVAPFVVGLVLYGGAKHVVGKITYPRTDPEVWYLLDNGSYVTNDAVHVAFSRNLIVPASASFYLYGLELSYTNQADWAEHSFCAYSNTFAQISQPFDLPHPAATNFNWIAFTDWTPPPVTHTNGVAYVAWQIGVDKSMNELVPYRTGVYTNGVRVAPSPAITNGPPVGFTLQLTPNTQDDE